MAPYSKIPSSVISTDCKSGPREILAPGTVSGSSMPQGSIEQVQYGLMVSVGDTQALAKAMQLLLTNGELAEQLSCDGVRRVEQFEKTLVARDYLECAGTVLAG